MTNALVIYLSLSLRLCTKSYEMYESLHVGITNQQHGLLIHTKKTLNTPTPSDEDNDDIDEVNGSTCTNIVG